MRQSLFVLALLSSTASATPMIRGGANHHLGDDSWRAELNRRPAPTDSEKDRMHVHLQYVRELLGAGAATRPELAERRAELLGYLDDYIRLGITPHNDYVNWRNPVFIDRGGNICAVGYLLERSGGRALPEAIAAAHRLDYLEDIAAAMPEVAAWVESSGFTLDELASIQPGYMGPEVQYMAGWSPEKDDEDRWMYAATPKLVNGAYSETSDGITLAGAIRGKQMTGTWTRKLDKTGAVLGTGKFSSGAGTWKSMRPDGTRMAEGPFVASHAHGSWKFFHPSGRIAASGQLVKGKRSGTWTFFYDQKGSPKLATVEFRKGFTVGGKHFDTAGKLVAEGWNDGPGLRLTVPGGKGGVTHEIHQGIPAEGYRLDAFYQGKERIFVRNDGTMFDGNAHLLAKTEKGWVARSCTWNKKVKKAAAGDIAAFHVELIGGFYAGDNDENSKRVDPSACTGDAVAVPADRMKTIQAMIGTHAQRHTAKPVFSFPLPVPADRAEVADEPVDEDTLGDSGQTHDLDAPADDMVGYLARHMNWYIEWPHVDDTFFAVYRSLPGYTPIKPPQGE